MFNDSTATIIVKNKSYNVSQLDQLKFNHPSKEIVLILADTSLLTIQAYISAMNSKHAVMLLPSDIHPELMINVIHEYQPYWIVGLHEFEEYEFNGQLLVRTSRNTTSINDDLALLLSTSGTTGSQRFVRLSYENLKSNALSIIQYLEINDMERAVMNLPLSYSYGMSIMNSHLLANATVLITDERIMEKSFWTFIENQRATSIAGVPFTYQMLHRIGITKMDLPHLKTLTQAGGRLSEKLVRYFGEWALANDKRFFVMYGQTEASPRMSFIPFDKVVEKAGTIGIAVPGGELFIENEELVYKGQNVMMGYAECRDDLSKGDEMGGILHTGDTAIVDEDGYFTITGRLKRFIKLFGLRINLDEIEKKLESTLQVSLACTGSDDKLIVAIEQEESIELIKNEIEALYHLHKTAYKVKVLKIPRFANGKTDYMKLKELCL